MKRTTLFSRFFVGITPTLFLFLMHASAQKVILTEEKYIQPPKEIADIVTAPRHLNVTLNELGTDRESFVIVRSEGLPTLEQYSKPFVNLGEAAFDFKANRARQFNIRRNAALEILNYKTGNRTEIAAPKGMWLSTPAWSPDGLKIAYFVHSEDATNIYISGVKDGKPRKITQSPVLATLVTSIEWTPDSKGILTVLVPAARKQQPTQGSGPDEPQVRISNSKPSPNRTYRFLLRSPHDKDLLEWLATGQLAFIDVNSGTSKNIGEPGMYKSLDISPDGNYIRATTLLKPFSYIVPLSEFGTLEAIYDLGGKKLADIQKLDLREATVTRGAAAADEPRQREGDRRSISWRPDGKGISFLELEPRKKDETAAEETSEESRDQSKRKDKVMQWLPPFDSSGLKVVFENDTRIGNARYSQDGETLFLTETKENEQHLFAIKSNDTKTKHTIYKHRTRDVYTDPGTLMTRTGDRGGTVVRVASDGQSAFLSGTRYFRNNEEKAPRPFISKFNFMTGESKRIFESAEDTFENVLTAADDDINVIFISRETSKTVPDCYVRDLRDGSLRKLTNNVDYAPEITKATQKRFRVERVDGIKFWVQLTLPPDYVAGTKLPALFWFYPREYQSQRAYDESAARYNRNGFPRVGTRSMTTFTLRGYAVVEPDCPIIGPQGQMNNNYVSDLRNNLWAVIDALDQMGYIDRDRLAIGGHSYGAFSAANAMVQTPFFKAGIAGDGNYNRTLTPITFQSERRWLWEARDVYLNMSPFLYANQLNGALLMYHGQDDANNGTDPINSERLFQVLNGLGKTAAVYYYPYEDHGPAMRETLLDLWARWDEWLDKYVKNPKKQDKSKAEAAQTTGAGNNP